MQKKEGVLPSCFCIYDALAAHVFVAVVNRLADIGKHAAASGKDMHRKILILIH